MCLGLPPRLGVAMRGALAFLSANQRGAAAALSRCFPKNTGRRNLRIRRGAIAQSATILVVDDDPLITLSTVDMLEDLGHTVIEANSAQRALEILETGQAVDLLITDHVMPGMSGIELAAAVHEKRPTLPVILASGYGDVPGGKTTDLPRLPKPYLQAQLREHIDRLLQSA